MQKHNPPSTGQYVFAALMPIVGIILGIVAAARNQIGPACGLWATSVVAWFAYFVLLAALASA